ncbi:MAG: hypothetical protein IE880_05460, partial [Epsilonproteobacteria bacterium]|nr:hypothetical protein [Campylobacterota bacterium]
MKKIRSSLATFLILGTLAFAGGDIAPAELEVATSAPAVEETFNFTYSANMAFTSNYVWRGLTQTDNSPAIQGGIDIGYKGFYAGVWGSNVEFGSVLDESMELD